MLALRRLSKVCIDVGVHTPHTFSGALWEEKFNVFKFN